MVEFLLSKGAFAEVPNNEGLSAMACAADNDTLNLLLHAVLNKKKTSGVADNDNDVYTPASSTISRPRSIHHKDAYDSLNVDAVTTPLSSRTPSPRNTGPNASDSMREALDPGFEVDPERPYRVSE